jgi:hypothetical protein
MTTEFQIEPAAGAPTIAISIDAIAAQRKVNGWVGSHVADMLMATSPTLILSSAPPHWRVPVVLGSSKGVIGQVGTITVNAQTGAVITSPDLIDQLRQQAIRVAEGKQTGSSPLNSGN